MENLALANEASERRAEPRIEVDQYHSVEFSVNGLKFSYQFKIWNVASSSMCVMVREDSDLLARLKVGDVLNMKYYSNKLSSPFEHYETEIRHITKDDNGKFRGHYMIGLSILPEELSRKTH
jgi:hypothetical protein